MFNIDIGRRNASSRRCVLQGNVSRKHGLRRLALSVDARPHILDLQHGPANFEAFTWPRRSRRNGASRQGHQPFDLCKGVIGNVEGLL